jgi:hypothetical protein
LGDGVARAEGVARTETELDGEPVGSGTANAVSEGRALAEGTGGAPAAAV